MDDEAHGARREAGDDRIGHSCHETRLVVPESGETVMLKQIPEIQDNFRLEPIGPGWVTPRRDPVRPVPVGTYVVMAFRVTGYDPDCDGSLMARLAAVDKHGEETGWEPAHLGLYPDCTLVVDDPAELWTR